MKRFYENPKNDRCYLIELDEYTFEIKTLSGKTSQFYQEKEALKEGQKAYKKLETAQNNFDKRCKSLEDKGFLLSDPDFPLENKRDIENAQNETILNITVYHEKCFDEIAKLTQLEQLALQTGVPDIDIPESLGKLTQLSYLAIYGTFQSLPDNLGDLQNLEQFNLYGDWSTSCTITQIPESLCQCKKLTTLALFYSDVTSLPQNIGKLQKLHYLQIKRTPVTSLPSSIGDCKSLVKIDASHSSLQSIPPEFGKLSSLREVDFQYSKLTSFPLPLTDLPNLESLNLSANQFTSIPDDIGKMQSLKSVHIHAYTHAVKGFTEGITQLQNLEELILSGNDLPTLSPNIGNLQKLKMLLLNGSKVKTLPDSLFDLKNLEELNLSYNELTELSPKLLQLENLEELYINDNPFTHIPEDVRDSEVEIVFDYLREKAEGKNAVKSDALDDATRGDLLLQYQKSLADFKKRADREFGQEQKDMLKAHAFLSFQTDTVPRFLQKRWYDEDGLFSIYQFFETDLDQWTEMEDRLMQMLTQNHWGKLSPLAQNYDRDEGLSWCFFKWYKEQTQEDNEPNYEEVQKLLKEYEKEKGLFEQVLGHLHDLLPKGKAPQFGQVLIEQFRENPEALLKSLHRHQNNNLKEISANVIDFLIQNDYKTFEQYAEYWFFFSTVDRYGNDQYYFNLDNLRAFVEQNPAKHEALFFKVIERIRYVMHYPQMAIDLKHLYGDKHKEKIIELALENLTYVLLDSWFCCELVIDKRTKCNPLDFFNWLTQHYKNEVKEALFLRILSKPKEYHQYYASFIRTYKNDTLPLVRTLLKHEVNVTQILPLLHQVDYSEYHDLLWNLLGSKEGEIRKATAKEIKRLYDDSTLLEKLQDLTSFKEVETRDGAIQLLILLETKEKLPLLKDLLEKESDHDIRENIMNTLNAEGEGGILLEKALKGYEAMKAKGKLKKAVKKWLNDIELPNLHWKNGEKVDADLPHYLFQVQKKKVKDWYTPSQEVQIILDEIDKGKSGDFAYELLKLIEKNGGIKAANKILLPIVSVLGDNRTIDHLEKYCVTKNNELSANLLGNSDQDKAARSLDAIMLKYKTKYPNVKAAASRSFDKIAHRKGLTRLELFDKMIPNFGFENLFKTFEVDGKEWKAFISSDLKLAYLNELDKIKKTLSTKASKELKDEFKNLNKEIRTIVKQQKVSLENYFMNGRKWDKIAWEEHFMQKPLMFAFAQNLVWGTYQDGKLQTIFGVNQDQTLENVHLDEIELPNDVQIGMVHPLELDEEKLKNWKNYLEENKIKQSVLQIHRPIFVPEKTELIETVLKRFDGVGVKAGGFKSVLEKSSWNRGAVQDAGGVYSYYKLFENHDIQVVLTVEGIGVQIWDFNANIGLRELFFSKAWSIDIGMIFHNYYQDESAEGLIRIKDLPPVIYSEIMYDLHLLTGKI